MRIKRLLNYSGFARYRTVLDANAPLKIESNKK